MKVGIVTLYSAFNYGAYLQAYAMQKKISSMGHSPFILDIETVPSIRSRYRTLISKKPSTVAFNIRKLLAFRAAWSRLPIASKAVISSSSKFDAIVLGSDEIWNVCNPTFTALPEYFGLNLDTENIISYAPSASESALADLANRVDAIRGLKRINHISVRDEKTQNIVKEATGRLAEIVVDPTFLVDFGADTIPSTLHKFLLVYSYGLSSERIRAVQHFAKTKGLRTVSSGFNNTWCDIVLPSSPFEFIGLVNAADYIVTDTFHGTIFSILGRKKFCSYAKNKMKIRFLLESLGLSDRIAADEQSLDAILENFIDYDAVTANLNSLIDKSNNFLTESLQPHQINK